MHSHVLVDRGWSAQRTLSTTLLWNAYAIPANATPASSLTSLFIDY